jgi:hypothetical protein
LSHQRIGQAQRVLLRQLAHDRASYHAPGDVPACMTTRLARAGLSLG